MINKKRQLLSEIKHGDLIRLLEKNGAEIINLSAGTDYNIAGKSSGSGPVTIIIFEEERCLQNTPNK
jgi:hypothetical protein